MKSIFATAVVALFGTFASAQSEPRIVRLTLHPASAPVPALRYKLLPEQRDLTPGNAVQLYYRAFSPEWWMAYRRDVNFYEKLEKASKLSLHELKTSDVSGLLNLRQLMEVDRGARRQYCDWEFNPRLREDGIAMVLPDMQSMRIYAQLLTLRARLELAEKDYGKVARTAQTGLALGRHIANGPIVIQSLIGVACCTLMLSQLEEWVQQPDSPNLYWALTDLPTHLVDLRHGIEGEKIWLDSYFGDLRDMLQRSKLESISAEQLRSMKEKILSLIEMSGGRRDPLIADAAMLFSSPFLYRQAKAFLTGRGYSAAEVEALPVLQVILLHQVATYDRIFDDMIKWRNLPYPVSRVGMRKVDQELRSNSSANLLNNYSLARLLLPALSKVLFASVRVDRQVAALRVIEALRLHAADKGRLPDSLSDISEVLAPIDPVTETSFEYRREGERAILSGPPPKDEPPYSGNSFRYELTLAPKTK